MTVHSTEPTRARVLDGELFHAPDSFELADWAPSPDFLAEFPGATRTRVGESSVVRALEAVHSSNRSPITLLVDGVALFGAGLGVGISPAVAAVVAALALVVACYLGRVYADRDTMQTKGIGWYPSRVAVPIGLVVLLGLVTHRLSAEVAMRFGPAAMLALVGIRCLTWSALVTLRGRGRALRRTLIVGSGPSALAVARKLVAFPEAGLDPIGSLPLRELLLEDGMSAAIKATGAEHVVLVPQPGDEAAMVASLRRCDGLDAWFSMLPPMSDLLLHPASVNQIGGLPLVPLGQVLRGRTTFPGKRLFDLVFAVIALVVVSPLLLITAIAIRCDDGAPVIFRQTRVGRGGKSFGMWKFRSMVVGADQQLVELRSSKHNVADGLLFKHVDDPRITRVGKHIRRWSIDELPQLWNVIRGQMSLVGPRPLPVAPEEFDAVENGRHSVLPGITGYWQISGGNGLSYHEMVRLDLAYIHTWSWWLDLRLLAKTVPALTHREGPT